MLERQPWMRLAPYMLVEWRQCLDEGLDVARFKDECVSLTEKAKTANCEAEAAALADKLHAASVREGFPYSEPSPYPDILAALPHYSGPKARPSEATLRDKLRGAWTGRIAGCLLGKPLESLRSALIDEILRSTGNYPMSRYVLGRELPRELSRTRIGPEALGDRCWADTIGGAAPVDDDTNYTVFALKLVETYGRDFTSSDVLEGWLRWLPMLSACTAERAAYRNAAMGLLPPETATYKNPYREWIGAQIRGDFFGYINPGDTRRAAEMAFRDASVSHVKNGVYGEMFAAAMIASAAVTDDIEEIIGSALGEIPRTSRLYEGVSGVLSSYRAGRSWDEVHGGIHARFDENDQHDWCHTISNAMIVASALLYGGGDFGKSVCLAVQSAFDTDCNGATVGSVVGMLRGAGNIPSYWGDAFHHKLRTSLDGLALVTVDELVDRTLRLL